MVATTTTPKLFLTDYESYNNGTQFEFGHWVDLSEFSSADEFLEYIETHFKAADEKSPLPCGTPREETMFTDYEGMPRALYSESMSAKELANLFEFLALDEDDRRKTAFIMEQGESVEYALSKYSDVIMHEDTDNAKYELFEMYYPEAEQAEQACPYVEINYDRFIKENFTEFEYEGQHYLVEDSWNY